MSYFASIDITKFEFAGITIENVNTKFVNLTLLIATSIIFLVFNGKAISDYLEWRRNVQIADTDIKQKHRKKRREMMLNIITQTVNTGTHPSTTQEEDKDDLLVWEEDTWFMSKRAFWMAYFKIFLHFVMPNTA